MWLFADVSRIRHAKFKLISVRRAISGPVLFQAERPPAPQFCVATLQPGGYMFVSVIVARIFPI